MLHTCRLKLKKAAFLGYILLIALFEITILKKDEDYNHLILQLIDFMAYWVMTTWLYVCPSVHLSSTPQAYTNVK